MIRQQMLGLHDSVDGIQGACKDNKERITMDIYYFPIMGLTRLPQESLMILKQSSIFFAQLLQESRGAFNIGK